MKRDPMLGKTYGRLLVLRRAGGKPHAIYLCACSCGTETSVRGDVLRSHRTKSCGCLQRERAEVGQYQRWARLKASAAAVGVPTIS